jgi:hypothetical protein
MLPHFFGRFVRCHVFHCSLGCSTIYEFLWWWNILWKLNFCAQGLFLVSMCTLRCWYYRSFSVNFIIQFHILWVFYRVQHYQFLILTLRSAKNLWRSPTLSIFQVNIF